MCSKLSNYCNVPMNLKYLPEELDPGPRDCNHDWEEEEGDARDGEKDCLVSGAQHQVCLVGLNLNIKGEFKHSIQVCT